MAYQTNFDPTPPSSVAPRPWWSRPMMTIPPYSRRKPTGKEVAALCAPYFAGLFTVVILFSFWHLIFLFIAKPHSQAKISLQSLAVSSATWQGDFLVKIPSWRYSIYYDVDGAAVSLGSQSAAVLNISRQRVSKYQTAFSLFFVAEEGNRSHAVSEDLDIKLMAKRKVHIRFNAYDEAGHFNIRCQNVTRGREKIVCESSFQHFNLFSLWDYDDEGQLKLKLGF